jgi:hypothetical protein
MCSNYEGKEDTLVLYSDQTTSFTTVNDASNSSGNGCVQLR